MFRRTLHQLVGIVAIALCATPALVDRDNPIATPGLRFLAETGNYMEIGHMLSLGGGKVRVVGINNLVQRPVKASDRSWRT